ncbi:MAG: T9SS type A sorting domain-containing protein [Bacteroidetes bacterium]|nr:T9SS type A sorting domain-containing protein [Bacteroidota bacterium]
MKKLVFVAFLLLAVTNGFAKKVKFAVDMDTFAISPNGIHVTGDFQAIAGYPGGDWTSNETVCIQEGSTTIYSVIVELPAFAKYEYKFVNGDQFYEVEFVPVESRVGYDFDDNRWLWVDSIANDTTFVGAIKFAGNAPAGLNLVRYLVDLNNQTAISNRPHVAGNFQNWNPATTSLYSFGDSIFEIISYVDSGTYQYKFVNGNAWGFDESIPSACNVNGNRSITVAKDTVLSAFCFGSCTVCNPTAVHVVSAQSEFSIFPNPAKDFIRVNLYKSSNLKSIQLTDLAGRIVLKFAPESNIQINRNDIPSGIYFVVLQDGDGKKTAKKIILQ